MASNKRTKSAKKKSKKKKGISILSDLKKFTLIVFILFNIYIFLSEQFFDFNWLGMIYLYLTSYHIIFFGWWALLLMLIVVWVIDIFMKLKHGTFKKQDKAVIFSILLILVLLGISLFSHFNVKYNLNEIYDKDNGFFVVDDEVYYFTDSEFNYMDKFFLFASRSGINKINVDGKNNEKLCAFHGNGLTYFLMKKENDLYFTNNYNSYKMDISNCKITKVDDFFDDFEKVFDPVYGDNYIFVADHQSIQKYDFKNEKIVDSLDIFMNTGLIDFEKMNSYDIGYGGDSNQYIFENDKKLYKFSSEDEKKNTALLSLTKNNLYFSIDYDVYKINLSNKKVNKVGKMGKSFEYQYAMNYGKYFVKDGFIYEYNVSKNKFEKIIDKKFEWFENNVNMYFFDDKVLFEDELNNMLIYDTKTMKYREFNKAKYSYDPIKQELFILIKDGKKVNVEKIK